MTGYRSLRLRRCCRAGDAMPSVVNESIAFARLLRDLPAFLREKTSLDAARARIRERIDRREEHFLQLVREGIYGYPSSPYLPLLREAGCEYGDLCERVRSRGIEQTLDELHAAGVYVCFDEFKGREPLSRQGRPRGPDPHAFDNPAAGGVRLSRTSGSTGTPTSSPADLNWMAEHAGAVLLAWNALGVLDAPKLIWRGIYPDGSGTNSVLRMHRFGATHDVWYSQLPTWDLRPASAKFTLATWALVLWCRLNGHRLPLPRYLPSDQPDRIAGWARAALDRHGSCAVQAVISRAVRVALAAGRMGHSLEGATFIVGGEAITPAKARAVTDTGARCVPTYALAECGRIGMICTRPASCNDVHLMHDFYALRQNPQTVPGTDRTVPAFTLTTLHPGAPRVMLNIEIDDYGTVEQRDCGCPFAELGYHTHIRDIYSYRKLTTEGVTLAGTEILTVLEQALPARFGGGPLDYQLVETEDEEGLPRLDLRVSPRVSLRDGGEEVSRFFLREVGRSSSAADQARSIWRHTHAVRVRREEPVLTDSGKHHPIRDERRVAAREGRPNGGKP